MADLVINGDARELDLNRFDGPYKIIVADPPWEYGERRKTRLDNGKPTCQIGARLHYEPMTTDEIARMPIRQIAAKRSLLFLWSTCPLLPEAIRVLKAWGFKYATVGFVWVKLYRQRVSRLPTIHTYPGINPRMPKRLIVERILDPLVAFLPGYYTASNIELVLIGRRGDPSYRHADGHKARQIIFGPPGRHSSKPEAMQDRIEYMWPDVTPRLELFARRPRQGWDVFGDEV